MIGKRPHLFNSTGREISGADPTLDSQIVRDEQNRSVPSLLTVMHLYGSISCDNCYTREPQLPDQNPA